MIAQDDVRSELPSVERFGDALMRGIENRGRPSRVRRGALALIVIAVATPLAVAGANELAGDEPASDAPKIATDPATVDACANLLNDGKYNYPCIKIVEEFAPERLPDPLPAPPDGHAG